MHALSHFSYHATTEGRYVLCDVQGGVYYNGVIVTDPCILSSVTREFGETDLGPEGRNQFVFCQHRCNGFCKSPWLAESHTVFSTTNGNINVIGNWSADDGTSSSTHLQSSQYSNISSLVDVSPYYQIMVDGFLQKENNR
jgi:hypothetical protein